MLEALLLGLSVLVCVLGSFTDLKTREVPDWLNYAGIMIGLGVHTILGVMLWNSWFVLESVLGLGVAFGIGVLMYYTGQWGGGDSKLLMAVGALLGFRPMVDNVFVAFLFWSVVGGAVYGLAWSVVLMLQNRHQFVKAFKQVLSTSRARFVRKSMYASLAVGIVTTPFVTDVSLQLLFMLVFFGIPLYALLFASMKAVEHACMIKKVKPSMLTEGDWIAKEVVVNGNYITGPKELGITKEQLLLLQKLAEQKKNQASHYQSRHSFCTIILDRFDCCSVVGKSYCYFLVRKLYMPLPFCKHHDTRIVFERFIPARV